MPTVERTLLIVNRAAGIGHSRAVADRLCAVLARFSNGRLTPQVEIVGDHPTARARATEFLKVSEATALILVGGGGGTLRAVIEGLCKGSEAGRLPGQERVLLGTLRMGSGNVVAKHFGVARDPETGTEEIVKNLQAGHSARCCVLRCEVGTREGGTEVHHAVTLGGFGQFGRIPGDLARWQQRLPALRRIAAKYLGIERLTNVEYALALLIRAVSCALLGSSMTEMVEVRTRDRRKVLRLLAGVVINFPFKVLPVEPSVEVEDEALSLYLVPYTGRLSALLSILAPRRLLRGALRIRIEEPQGVQIRLLDRDAAEFFLDEDPMILHGQLNLQVAGSLTFVPGAEYRIRAQGEVLA